MFHQHRFTMFHHRYITISPLVFFGRSQQNGLRTCRSGVRRVVPHRCRRGDACGWVWKLRDSRKVKGKRNGKGILLWDLKGGFVSGGFSLLLSWVLKLFAQTTKAKKLKRIRSIETFMHECTHVHTHIHPSTISWLLCNGGPWRKLRRLWWRQRSVSLFLLQWGFHSRCFSWDFGTSSHF